jgi:trk system potassium uptake protein TrkA
MMMKVIVVGCGRVGAELAYRLSQRSHKVTVVDMKAEAFHNLPVDFRGRIVEGEALNKEVMERAGISEADALAAVTSSDALNATVAHVARTFYSVPSVIVRNFDSRWRAMHEAFGLQVVSSSSWGAQRIEELLYQQETRTIFSAGNGEVEIYEFTIPESWNSHAISELLPEKDCVLVALTRAGRASIPERHALMDGGDVITISATLDGSETLRTRLTAGPGQS